ncbi:hypothetical protein N8981_03225 [Planktomarina temperata]|nr:hypothetical protein [Planktomarina temperata]
MDERFFKEKETLEMAVYNFVATAVLIAILQAILSNFINLNVPILTIWIIYLAAHPNSQGRKHTIRTFLKIDFSLMIYILGTICFLLIFLNGLLNKNTFIKEWLYQLHAIIILLCVYCISEKYEWELGNEKYLASTLFLFCSGSLVIHFFFWDTLAVQFYNNRFSNLGGLYFDGTYRKLYGLLFNPIATAITLFLVLLIISEYRERYFYSKLLLYVCLACSLSRGIYICAGTYVIGRLIISNHYWVRQLSRVSFSLIALYLVLFDIDTLPSIFSDSTGSTKTHLYSITMPLTYLLNFTGEGFHSDVLAGSSIIRLESWILNFAYANGQFVGIILTLIIVAIVYKRRFRSRTFGMVSSLSILPLFIVYPLYTFNLPLVLLCFYISMPKSINSSKKRNRFNNACGKSSIKI